MERREPRSRSRVTSENNCEQAVRLKIPVSLSRREAAAGPDIMKGRRGWRTDPTKTRQLLGTNCAASAGLASSCAGEITGASGAWLRQCQGRPDIAHASAGSLDGRCSTRIATKAVAGPDARGDAARVITGVRASCHGRPRARLAPVRHDASSLPGATGCGRDPSVCCALAEGPRGACWDVAVNAPPAGLGMACSRTWLQLGSSTIKNGSLSPSSAARFPIHTCPSELAGASPCRDPATATARTSDALGICSTPLRARSAPRHNMGTSHRDGRACLPARKQFGRRARGWREPGATNDTSPTSAPRHCCHRP